MTIRLGDETYYISTKPTAGADLATDAELAAVRIKGGKVVGAVLVRGSRLIWRGRSLLEKASAVDYAETALQ